MKFGKFASLRKLSIFARRKSMRCEGGGGVKAYPFSSLLLLNLCSKILAVSKQRFTTDRHKLTIDTVSALYI